jgi:trimeric autotransporter adhesin
VKFHLNRFLRRVRIHGGEFDTSARAMYRVSEKGSLISYEKAFSTRADLRIVRGSTIERKQMSTKTTFKRIALVTVAALGFGTMAAISPASATTTTTTALTSISVTGTTAGTAADPFATGSAINLNVLIDLTAATTADETFTVTYNAYNPKGETITGITLVETSTSVSLLGDNTDTGTVKAVANTLVFESITTAAARTVATLTIPAAGVTTGGIYTVKATSITSSAGSITLAANNLDGTTSVARGAINVSGAQVTQGTVITTNTGAAVTTGNARVKFFFPKVAANGDVYRITSSGVGTILSEQGDGANTTPSYVSGSTYAGGVNVTAASASTASDIVLNLTSDVAGVQTLTFWSQSTATGALTAVFTSTVTWGAAPAYVASTAFIGATGAAVTADIAAASRKSAGAYDAAAKARIDVKQYTDAAKTIQTAGTAKAVLVTVSGAGAVDTDVNGGTRGVQALVAGSASAALDSTFYLFADGRTGDAVVTVTVNGVLVASWTWSFFGTATSLKEDADNSPTKTYIGVGETGTVSVLAYDTNSKAATLPASLTVSSDTATTASVVAGTNGSATVTGVAAGKSNINFCSGACASATVKVAIPVEITKTTAKTVTIAFDKLTYEPGEKMTLTVSAVDSNDRPVADGSRALFAAALTSNVSFGGASVALPAASVTLAGGKATYTLYAPSAGTITVTGKEGTATDSTTKAAITSAAVTVVNSALDAATSAAELAEAAAQDATDAALDATEAATLAGALAQEAVDAVADLSTQVATLIAALKKQITTLTNLVIKIQKKVRA